LSEMQVVSNYSGWEHNDRGDFKKRVDESLAKLTAAAPSQPAKPEAPAKSFRQDPARDGTVACQQSATAPLIGR